MTKIYKNRFLILRRFSQLSILLLFFGWNAFGWEILQGTFSTVEVLNSFYLVDPYVFLQMIFAGAIAGLDIIIGVLIVFVFYALIGGRSFCSWVCPVNIISDFALWIRKIFKLKSVDLNVPLTRNTRYYIMILGIIVSAFTSMLAFETFNPITMIQRGVIFGLTSGISAAIVILFLDLFVKKNAWCGHLCPVGAMYSTISKVHLIKVYHEKDNCTNCNKCFTVCPEVQVLDLIGKRSGFVASGECTNCGRCIEVCDDNALNFKINKFSYKE